MDGACSCPGEVAPVFALRRVQRKPLLRTAAMHVQKLLDRLRAPPKPKYAASACMMLQTVRSFALPSAACRYIIEQSSEHTTSELLSAISMLSKSSGILRRGLPRVLWHRQMGSGLFQHVLVFDARQAVPACGRKATHLQPCRVGVARDLPLRKKEVRLRLFARPSDWSWISASIAEDAQRTLNTCEISRAATGPAGSGQARSMGAFHQHEALMTFPAPTALPHLTAHEVQVPTPSLDHGSLIRNDA